jgi:hypothetical protein
VTISKGGADQVPFMKKREREEEERGDGEVMLHRREIR